MAWGMPVRWQAICMIKTSSSLSSTRRTVFILRTILSFAATKCFHRHVVSVYESNSAFQKETPLSLNISKSFFQYYVKSVKRGRNREENVARKIVQNASAENAVIIGAGKS